MSITKGEREAYYRNLKRLEQEGAERAARIQAARKARKATEFRMVCPACDGTDTRGITAHQAKCRCGHTFQGPLAALREV